MTPAVLLAALAACGTSSRSDAPPAWTPAQPDDELHPVAIARPVGAGKLPTALVEISGAPARIGCPTCHAAGTEPAFAPDQPDSANRQVHAAIVVRHADLKCTSCHVAGEPNLLRSVDFERFAIEDSMRLCSQCHGPVRRAYDNGAHGGMRGYWDLQRGPRTRNDCITCHDPHAPAYPQVSPAPGPVDRFPPASDHHAGGDHE